MSQGREKIRTIVLGSLELPESDINGDTTLTLGLELVKNPGILERTLAELSSLLFELLDGTLVDTTALVDKVSSGGGLAGIDVADNYYKLRFATMHDGRRKNSPTTLTWVFSFPILIVF